MNASSELHSGHAEERLGIVDFSYPQIALFESRRIRLADAAA
jgi:hypothetical protein